MQRLVAGKVEVRLHVTPTHLTTAGTITAELEVAAPTALTVEISSGPAPRPGQLSIASDILAGPVTLRPGTMQYRRHLVYRPFLGGKYEVPAFIVSYRSAAANGQLVTAPVPLVVASVVEGDPAVAKPAGILPIEPAAPVEDRTLRWSLGAAALAIAVAAWLLVRHRRRQNRAPAPPPPPFGATLAAVESLPADDVRGLERAIEALRRQQRNPLPAMLRDTYQWIRFGSPTGGDVARFRASLTVYLRDETRAESAKEAP